MQSQIFHYTIGPDGAIVRTRVAVGNGDSLALVAWLALLDRDMTEHPERLQVMDAGLVQRIQTLVDGVTVDLDASLSADDA